MVTPLPRTAAEILTRLPRVYGAAADPGRAVAMATYMRDRYPFLGIPAPAQKLLAREVLAGHKGAPIVYDLRSSWVVKEEILRHGGVPIRDRVGHSFIKATMRAKGALFGGELSGHFYFAENFVSDSGVIAMVSALNLLAREKQPFSAMVSGLRRYHSTGEINFHVEDKAAAIAALKQRYSSGRADELDGITVEFGELGDAEWWWFNVRPSNTEPLLRLNLEASSAALRDRRRDEIVGLLGEPEA
jgi:phosphomannomutase